MIWRRGTGGKSVRAQQLAAIHARHPGFRDAVVKDALVTLYHRGEPRTFGSRRDALTQIVRLAWSSDAFLAQMIYRAKARLQARGILLAPGVAHRLAIAVAQICIGDPVVIEPGVYIPHGQVVIDGITTIGTGAVIAPFTTIGLVSGNMIGPTIQPGVAVGTGARILGPLTVGADAQIGANAVVIRDVPAGTTAVGVPAHAR